jgi:hypothetical protein
MIREDVWSLYHRAKYDTAVFEAMKAVEVAVRDAGELPDSLLGVKLMRAAFAPSPNAGPLTDTGRRRRRASRSDGTLCRCDWLLQKPALTPQRRSGRSGRSGRNHHAGKPSAAHRRRTAGGEGCALNHSSRSAHPLYRPSSAPPANAHRCAFSNSSRPTTATRTRGGPITGLRRNSWPGVLIPGCRRSLRSSRCMSRLGSKRQRASWLRPRSNNGSQHCATCSIGW